MSQVVGEDALAERPALEWLERAGWTLVHGSELEAERPGGERKLWSDVVLVERFRDAIACINPHLPREAVEAVSDRALTATSPVPIESHRDFHEMLLAGIPITYTDEHGIERDEHAKLVDFADPGRNDLIAVNQFTIIDGGKNRRPDIILFVNGLPLGQIELKRPSAENAAESAVNQVRHYTDTIPGLYRYVEAVGVSDLLDARVGTASTSPEHFAQWKLMGATQETDRRPALQVMVEQVFAPSALLELIRDFVLFESDGARTWKVMAKYHQVHAVRAAVESAAAAMAGDKRAGIVWHTQGAGKSYTMIFFANKLRRDPRFANPTIVAVTDRTDLDNQLLEKFTATHLASTCRQAQEITGGVRSLYKLLNVPAGGIVFTTIQKFRPPRGQTEMPQLSERQNIVVMADEAHRSQYRTFAQNITKALPAATRIGFTGTPVERVDRSTRLVFGNYVSTYRMRQAQEDRATVPIYYESRPIPIELADPAQLAEVEEVLEDEEPDAANKLTTAWAKLERVVGAPDRLDRVADDLQQHFSARPEGKAMVVAYSRRIAAELADRLKERFGGEAVTCVISASATDPPEMSRYRRSKTELRDLAGDFRDESHPLRIVVVKDMWLTGFDAPILHTLYIDKPMRDHGLLQAIARVNRVFRDKPGGLVVDYIGIGEDLRSSLRAYDDTELEDPVIPAAKAFAELWAHYEAICALLYPAGYRQGELPPAPSERSALFTSACDYVMESEERIRELLDEHATLARFYALVATQKAAIELREEIAWFSELAAAVRKVASVQAQASPAAEQAVRQFFSEGLAAGEIADALALADGERPDISILSDEFLDSIERKVEHPNIQMRLLEKLLKGEIRARGRTNQTQAKLFSDRVQDVLRRYELRQITSAEVIARLIEIGKSLRDARLRHEQLGLTPEEAAFYDALAGAEDVASDPQLATIAKALAKSIKEDLTVDWADRESTEAAIRRKIKRLLRQHNYQPPAVGASGGGGEARDVNHYAQLVLDQAKVLYRYWPEVEDRLFM
jgi:type I restriction enzyme R subunit